MPNERLHTGQIKLVAKWWSTWISNSRTSSSSKVSSQMGHFNLQSMKKKISREIDLFDFTSLFVFFGQTWIPFGIQGVRFNKWGKVIIVIGLYIQVNILKCLKFQLNKNKNLQCIFLKFYSICDNQNLLIFFLTIYDIHNTKRNM